MSTPQMPPFVVPAAPWAFGHARAAQGVKNTVHLMTLADVDRGRFKRGKGQAACRPDLFMIAAPNHQASRKVTDVCPRCLQWGMSMELIEWRQVATPGPAPVAEKAAREPREAKGPRRRVGPLPKWADVVAAPVESNDKDYEAYQHLPWNGRRARRGYRIPRPIPVSAAAWLEVITREKDRDRVLNHDPIPLLIDSPIPEATSMRLPGLPRSVDVEPVATEGSRQVIVAPTLQILVQVAPRGQIPWPQDEYERVLAIWHPARRGGDDFAIKAATLANVTLSNEDLARLLFTTTFAISSIRSGAHRSPPRSSSAPAPTSYATGTAP